MYIHAGNNKMLRTKSIVGIFDMDTATMAQPTREFLRAKERVGMLTNIRDELPKSFILTEDGNVYMSQISTQSLVGRAEYLHS